MFYDYYCSAFPFATIHRLFARQWETNGPSPDKREWGYETHPDGQYRRWKTCETAQQLHTFVQQANFGKLNIGAVFDKSPRKRWECSDVDAPKPVQREFVIDIDLDDYSRFGIQKDSLEDCDAFFGLVSVGLYVCVNVLRETFGFEHILAVYSGRRGGHLWVCDKRACLLSDAERHAIVSFLRPTQKIDPLSGRQAFKWLLQYPSFGGENAINRDGIFSRVVYKFFRLIGVRARLDGGLGLLDDGADRRDFLNMINPRFSQEFTMAARSAFSGMDALSVIEKAIMGKPLNVRKWMVPRFCEAVCTLLWPRIDEAVSTHMNHTLKSPFSIHPKTGRVSIPIQPTELLTFKPATDAPDGTNVDELLKNTKFLASIAYLEGFIDCLAASPTELYIPPDLGTLEPPCFDLRTPPMASTSLTPYDSIPIVSQTNRIAWKVEKMLQVYVDNAGVAHFKTCVKSYAETPSIWIQKSQFLPFKTPPRCVGAVSMIDLFLSCFMTCLAFSNEHRNTAMAVYNWSQLVIVEKNVEEEEKEASIDRADERFERLRGRLAVPNEVGVAKVAWGPGALESFARQRLWPLVDELIEL